MVQTSGLCFLSSHFHRMAERRPILRPAPVGNAALSVPPHRRTVRGMPCEEDEIENPLKSNFPLLHEGYPHANAWPKGVRLTAGAFFPVGPAFGTLRAAFPTGIAQIFSPYPRKKLIAPRRRLERASKRTDAASGTFCGKEERRNTRGMAFQAICSPRRRGGVPYGDCTDFWPAFFGFLLREIPLSGKMSAKRTRGSRPRSGEDRRTAVVGWHREKAGKKPASAIRQPSSRASACRTACGPFPQVNAAFGVRRPTARMDPPVAVQNISPREAISVQNGNPLKDCTIPFK